MLSLVLLVFSNVINSLLLLNGDIFLNNLMNISESHILIGIVDKLIQNMEKNCSLFQSKVEKSIGIDLFRMRSIRESTMIHMGWWETKYQCF